MPPAAYGLVALFTVVSIVVGLGAWWIVGPRRPWAALLPIAAAFGLLYLVGHRFGWQFGPNIELLGFQVAIVSDLAFALLGAFGAALAQRAAWSAMVRRRSGSVTRAQRGR